MEDLSYTERRVRDGRLADRTMLDMRADVAKRQEDLRIATKHTLSARLRGDRRGYAIALAWERNCSDELANATARLRAHDGEA